MILSAPPPSTAPAEKTSMQRAGEILFARDPLAPSAEAPPRSGRILEPVSEPTEAEAQQEEPEALPPRRRGRPPGSKNRLPAAEGGKAARGRPRLGPAVRQVKLTPELVTAAIESIAKLNPGQSPGGGDLSFGRRPGFEEGGPTVIKRPRGRPRKTPVAKVDSPSEVLPARAGFASRSELPVRPATPRFASTNVGDARRGAFKSPLKRSELTRLFKPGERWKARMRLRSLARRKRA